MQIAALYIRVSTEDQVEYSPDAQKRLLLDYANKNKMIVCQEYIFMDEGVSGRKAEKRPAFMRMIALAKRKPKPFDVILVHRFDRFSRSREDSIVYKSLLRKECDIKVISITEQLEDDKFSIILEAMLEAMAEYYSLNLSEEVKKGMTEKALRGGYQAGPPLGYDFSGDIPSINPEQANIVKLIFLKYVNEMMDFTAIARYLNNCGYRTKRENYFEQRVVRYILENPFYIGKVRWNRINHASHAENPENEIILVNGFHEAIISNELFYLAQKRLTQECKSYKHRDLSACKHWLSGLMKCSVCGKSLVYQNTKNRSPHFQCYGYSKGMHAGSHYITEACAIQCIISSLEKVILTNDINYEEKRITRDSSFEITLLKKELVNINEKRIRITAAYMNGVDTLEEYEANKQLLQDTKLTVELKIDHLKRSHNLGKDILIEKVKTVYQVIISDEYDFTRKGIAIRSIVEKIVFDKERKVVKVYYYL